MVGSHVSIIVKVSDVIIIDYYLLAVREQRSNESEIVKHEHKLTGANAPMDREGKESACADAHGTRYNYRRPLVHAGFK